MKKNMFDNRKSVKSIIIKALILLIILTIVTGIVLYYKNDKIQSFFDEYIFRKEVTNEEINSIEKSVQNNENIYIFDNKVIILNKNELEIYNRSGNKEKSIELEIATPIFESNSQYLYIAEKDGSKIYLISGNNIAWQKNLEGSIADICVNKNGYVAVNLKGTAYKNVIQIFDNTGTEVLTKYISSSTVEDIALSDNNEELAIAKIDYSGITIKSIIEIIDINKAETIKNYEAGNDDLIININYQKNKLVCMYDTYINIIENGNTVTLTNFDESKTLFASIDLNSSIIEVKKETNNIINSTIIAKIINSSTKKEHAFELTNEPKEIYSKRKCICFNSGTEVICINTNGMLIKKYTSEKEVQKIILGENIAGIIYNNEIRIINL